LGDASPNPSSRLGAWPSQTWLSRFSATSQPYSETLRSTSSVEPCVMASVSPISREQCAQLPVATTDRALVVVGGIPGAGKSTLLRGFTGVPDLRVLDPEQVADPLMRRLVGVPYSALRPLVHTVHWLRILGALLWHDGVVVVHETATRAAARAALVTWALVTARTAHLVWLDIDPATARREQWTRRRVLSYASFARHVRRASTMDPRRLRGWDSIVVVRQARPAPASGSMCRPGIGFCGATASAEYRGSPTLSEWRS
jgi:hypothetical protein